MVLIVEQSLKLLMIQNYKESLNFMKKLFLFGTLVLFFVLNACTAFKKNIKKPVTVSLIDTVLPTGINSTAQLPKYLNDYKSQQFINAFLKSFKDEANVTKNITFSFNNPDALLHLCSEDV